ncbi:MAG: thiamine diphosphokinase [Kiritimatiellaeota bacterium]|nr:thiamine diphosphokinase [Kiritimatiellota bacterium]
MELFTGKTVILANGAFPAGDVPLNALRTARRIICCDGAADNLLADRPPSPSQVKGGLATHDRAVSSPSLEPSWIVGDGDSVSSATRARFADRCRFVAEQDTNDLTKAFRFCVSQGWRDLIVLGATGNREDHTLGNLSLLADFAHEADVRALTDSGFFTPLIAPAQLESVAGQQVSLIACDGGMRVSAEGLKYPVRELALSRWWQGTLNEACGASFNVSFEKGTLLVFQTYEHGEW